MACYYTGSAEGDRLLAEQEKYTKDTDAANNTITKLSRMLCDVMHYMEDYDGNTEHLYKKVEGLKDFWEKHKKVDKEREEREAKVALHKLTAYEIQLLKKLGVMK